MKKSELKKLIKEEITKALSYESVNEKNKSEIWSRFKWDGRGSPFNFMKFKKFPEKGTYAEKMYHWHEDFAVAAIKCGSGGGCREYEKQAEEHYQEYLSAIKDDFFKY